MRPTGQWHKGSKGLFSCVCEGSLVVYLPIHLLTQSYTVLHRPTQFYTVLHSPFRCFISWSWTVLCLCLSWGWWKGRFRWHGNLVFWWKGGQDRLIGWVLVVRKLTWRLFWRRGSRDLISSGLFDERLMLTWNWADTVLVFCWIMVSLLVLFWWYQIGYLFFFPSGVQSGGTSWFSSSVCVAEKSVVCVLVCGKHINA